MKLAMCSLSLAALLIAETANAADRTVKIGVLSDMSGVAVDDMGPGSVLAAQMAAEDMGGSIAGMKIEIVFADHLQKPDVGATIVRHWFDQENVDAVADVPNSSVALAINQSRAPTTRCCCHRVRSLWN
jgi:branched-chain amino acid transport system substrate-binding protein